MSQYDSTCDFKINVGQWDLYFMVQWFCCICILKTIWCMNIILGDYESFWLDIWPKNKCRSVWLVFCVISWRLFEVWTSYFGNISVWPNVWPQNKCRSLCPIFHGPVILHNILKIIWYMNILWEYESVWPYVWLQNKCWSLWPIFHGPVILPTSWRLVDVGSSYFGVMSLYDPTFDLNVGHYDL